VGGIGRRITIQGQSWAKAQSKITKRKRAVVMTQVAGYLPSKHKSLSLNAISAKNKQNKNQQKILKQKQQSKQNK
jgi:hypothetical protein